MSSHCEARLLPSALNCVDGFQRETLTWVLTGDYNGRGFRLGHKVPQVRICAGVNPRTSIPFDTEVLRHLNHLESLLKYELMGPILRDSDIASMG